MEQRAGWDVRGDGGRGHAQPSSPWVIILTILQRRNYKASAAIKPKAEQAPSLSVFVSFEKTQGTSGTWGIPPSSWQSRSEGLGGLLALCLPAIC